LNPIDLKTNLINIANKGIEPMQENHNPQGMLIFLLMMAGNILFFVYISYFHEGIATSGLSRTVPPSAQIQNK
jgi:hypothetical protein